MQLNGGRGLGCRKKIILHSSITFRLFVRLNACFHHNDNRHAIPRRYSCSCVNENTIGSIRDDVKKYEVVALTLFYISLPEFAQIVHNFLSSAYFDENCIISLADFLPLFSMILSWKSNRDAMRNYIHIHFVHIHWIYYISHEHSWCIQRMGSRYRSIHAQI